MRVGSVRDRDSGGLDRREQLARAEGFAHKSVSAAPREAILERVRPAHDEDPHIRRAVAHEADQAKAAVAPQLHGGAFINRQAWKFQAWLQGYNGGPLRQPTQRIHDPQMNALRKGLLDAGLSPSMDPYEEFFAGRTK